MVFLFIGTFLFFTPFIVVLYLASRDAKREAEAYFSEMRIILNATTFKFKLIKSLWSYTAKKGSVIQCEGYFNSRKVKFIYSLGGFKMIVLISFPKLIAKKIPWYKLMIRYPKIFKNYVFDNKKIFLRTDLYSVFNYHDFTFDGNLSGKSISLLAFQEADKKLSHEKCIELLEDLNHACEMIEKGEYEI